MTEAIKHEGRVVSITGETVSVQIFQSSACSGCSAAKLCKSSETKEKIVSVRLHGASNYNVGDLVTVAGSVQQGLKATLWAYVIPLLLVLASIVATTLIGVEDAIVALVAIVVLAAYYFCLYMVRDRFERKFSFTLVE